MTRASSEPDDYEAAARELPSIILERELMHRGYERPKKRTIYDEDD